MAAWLDGRHPVVVVEAAGAVVGFAAKFTTARAPATTAWPSSACTWRAPAADVGRRLAMEALIADAAAAGFWKLVSRVFTENAASRRLLAALGFREAGVYERHGRLDGRWRDVVIVERLLPAAFGDGGPATRADHAP